MKIKVYARTPDFSGTWNIEYLTEMPDTYTPEDINIDVKTYLEDAWKNKGWTITDYAWERIK